MIGIFEKNCSLSVKRVVYSMNCIENGIHTTNGLSTEKHKSFLIHFGWWGGVDLKEKCILTCLYCNKWNKINMEHSDTEIKFLFLFLAFCSEFFTLIIRIFGFEGWQLWYWSNWRNFQRFCLLFYKCIMNNY